MVNRSNRHQRNPLMSTYYQYEKAIGIWCANSPLWPGINVCHLQRPDIRAQSSQFIKDSPLANEEESIYGHYAAESGGWCETSAFTLGFNRSMQHLDSSYREKDVAEEAKIENILH